jgi:hypothetical protein
MNYPKINKKTNPKKNPKKNPKINPEKNHRILEYLKANYEDL